MTKDEQLKFQTIYLQSGTLKTAFRVYKYLFYRHYEREIDADPDFKDHMEYLKNLIKVRKGLRITLQKKSKRQYVKMNEEQFLKNLSEHRTIGGACKAMGLSVGAYHKYKKVHPVFSKRADEIINEIRADNHYKRRTKTKHIPSIGWLPPNQELVTWHRYQ